jgi:hypothetical protein
MSLDQKDMYEKIKLFILKRNSKRIGFRADMPSRDRAFVLKLAKDLGLSHTIEFIDATSLHSLVLELESDDEESDEESLEARHRVFKRYDLMQVVDEELLVENLVESRKKKIDQEFTVWKSGYYRVSFKKFILRKN